MTYRQIFDEYEGKYRIQDKEIMKKFLEEFKVLSGVDWQCIAENEHLPLTDYIRIFWRLHTLLFTMNELGKYIFLFYQLLEKYHYNMREDYVSLVRLVGQNTSYCLPDNVRNFIMKAPYVDRIKDDLGYITIYSEKLGKITFYSTHKYFEDHRFVSSILRNNQVVRECHNISWKLMDFMPGSTLVTSLMPSTFSGTSYHTVIRDKKNLIVDAANSCVYAEENFHSLYQDQIICETKVEKIHSALSETSLLEGRGMANAMVLALHNQQKKL